MVKQDVLHKKRIVKPDREHINSVTVLISLTNVTFLRVTLAQTSLIDQNENLGSDGLNVLFDLGHDTHLVESSSR